MGGQGSAGSRNQKLLFNGHRFQLLKMGRDNGDDVTTLWVHLKPLTVHLRVMMSGKLVPHPLRCVRRGRRITLTETVPTPVDTCTPVGARKQTRLQEGAEVPTTSAGEGGWREALREHRLGKMIAL